MGKGGAADEELFSMLKDLRKKVAKQHGLPPFVIFQDPSLEDMAVQYPITFEEMQNITGVGVGKARKFGEEFIRLIKAYVEEKEIIRPQDKIEDIYLYFKEDAESDSLDAAIEELGADYTEEEIRLVRIKFMCEQGN